MLKEIRKALLKHKIVLVCHEEMINEIKSVRDADFLEQVIFIQNNHCEKDKAILITDEELKYELVYGKENNNAF